MSPKKTNFIINKKRGKKVSILKVLKTPHPKLRKKALSVEVVDEEIKTLMNDMLETMYLENGIGLAANQVGILKRVIVMDVPIEREDEQSKSILLKMVNPEITFKSNEIFYNEEGCLSVPEAYESIMRHQRISVSYINEHNELEKLEAEGLLSVCIQHEIDHLDGKLFIDYLSNVKRTFILEKIQKKINNHT
jgi:peptide deformylase